MMPLVQAVVSAFRGRAPSGKGVSPSKPVSNDPRQFNSQRLFSRLEEGSEVALPSNAAIVDDLEGEERRAIPLEPIHVMHNAKLDVRDRYFGGPARRQVLR